MRYEDDGSPPETVSSQPGLAEAESSGRADEGLSDATARAIEAAIIRERTRIARELHDGVASDLGAVVALFKYYFENAGQGADSHRTLRNIFESLETLLANTRATLQTMRPQPLGAEGLVSRLRGTVEDYERLHGIRIELWIVGQEDELSASQREVVFHVVREALTNVRRHSGSKVCRVRLAFAAKPFLIEVTDEGTGFEAGRIVGYGLIGMRERAAGIGGRLEVVTTPGLGTTVFLFGPEPAIVP